MTPPRSIPIARPAVGEEEWRALRESLESGWLIQGPKVRAFEDAFARRHGIQHAVATSNCTTALHLGLLAAGVGPGDEVIVPAYTWVATANAVLYAGATPVFVDVRGDSYNLDPSQIAAALSPRTKVVIAVHLFGLCADMDALRAGLPTSVVVIEDAACAAGAEYHGSPAGGLGQLACFSFHPRKSITTGEGGMLTTDDESIARSVRVMRNHGLSELDQGTPPLHPYLADVERLGFNYRLTDLQAAIGIVQLAKLDGFISERARWAQWYASELADIDWLRMPAAPPDYRHAWQAFVTVVDEHAPLSRDRLMTRLQEKGVATRPGTHLVPELTLYRERIGFEPERYPVATRLGAQALAIPLHNCMTADDYRYVVEVLHEF
ncbi:MAG: DegT/DnrJ/EryC1/StrS family aminotransferase [Gemmatimonadales bacterium]